MKKEYNLKELKTRPNPYTKKLKRSVTIRLEQDILDYFKKLGEKFSTPYQTLLNDYLRDCKEKGLMPKTVWKKG